jgi:hypothetical protein
MAEERELDITGNEVAALFKLAWNCLVGNNGKKDSIGQDAINFLVDIGRRNGFIRHAGTQEAWQNTRDWVKERFPEASPQAIPIGLSRDEIPIGARSEEIDKRMRDIKRYEDPTWKPGEPCVFPQRIK